MISKSIATALFTLASACVPFAIANAADDVLRICSATMETGAGQWRASRSITESGRDVRVSGDRFEWVPKQGIDIGADAYLTWRLSYYSESNASVDDPVDDRDMSIAMNFNFKLSKERGEPNKPERTWLHLYRSTDPNERRLAPTSLSSEMWWDKFADGSISGKASMPLDALLAFGQGYESLAWDIQLAPERLGPTQKLAKGKFPISDMPERKAAISKLRAMLNKRAARYKQECEMPILVTQ